MAENNFWTHATIASVSMSVFVLALIIIGTSVVTPILAQQVGEQIGKQTSADANVNIDLKFACVNVIFYIGCW